MQLRATCWFTICNIYTALKSYSVYFFIGITLLGHLCIWFNVTLRCNEVCDLNSGFIINYLLTFVLVGGLVVTVCNFKDDYIVGRSTKQIFFKICILFNSNLEVPKSLNIVLCYLMFSLLNLLMRMANITFLIIRLFKFCSKTLIMKDI